MAKLLDLVAILFRDMDGGRLRQWQEMLDKYLHVIWLAFQHEDFGDEEIEQFQDLIDEFFFVC